MRGASTQRVGNIKNPMVPTQTMTMRYILWKHMLSDKYDFNQHVNYLTENAGGFRQCVGAFCFDNHTPQRIIKQALLC